MRRTNTLKFLSRRARQGATDGRVCKAVSQPNTFPDPPFENALLGPRRVVPKVHERLLSEPPGGSDPRLPRSRAPGRSVLKVTVTSGGTHESAPSRQQRRARLTPRSRGRGRAGSRWIPERSISRPPGQPTSQRGLLWGWRWGGARLRPRCAHPTCSRGPHSTCLLARRGLPAPRAHPPVPPGCRAAGSPHPPAPAAPRPASARLSRGLSAGGPGAWKRRGRARAHPASPGAVQARSARFTKRKV